MYNKPTKEDIKARLRSAVKRYECDKCHCKMTLLVSLTCNCGGRIKEIKDQPPKEEQTE